MLKRIVQNKVFQNFSYLTIGSVLAQGLSLLTILKITRIFSPAEYGLFTFIMAQGLLLLAMADLGIRHILIRTIARDPSRTNDLMVNGALLKVTATVTLILCYLIYNSQLGSLTGVELMLLFAFTLLSSLAHLLETVFLGHEKMLPISLINLSYSAAWFLVVLLSPEASLSVVNLFLLFLGLNVFKVLVLWRVLSWYTLLIGKVGRFWQSSRALLLESWPYFSLVLILMPVNHFSNNFLDINSTADEIGYFNLSQKLLGPVTLVIGFALSAVFPNLSALWTKDRDRFYQIVSSGFKFFMLPALVLCALFTLFAREVVVILFTSDYLPAVKVCQLQVWFVFLMGVNSLIGTILGATNNEKLLLKLGVANAILSTPMLYVGSKFGALGLSYGYVISFAIFEIFLWIVFRKALRVRIEADALLWILAILLFVLSYFTPIQTSVVYRVLIGLILLGGSAIFLRRSLQPALMI